MITLTRRKYLQMQVPREFATILKVKYDNPKLKTNMARMRELVKELEAVTYGIKTKKK